MQHDLFLRELQHIECDLSSGITMLGQMEVMADEATPDRYGDALYVVYTYMRGVHKKLAQCIQIYEQMEGI